ncbi:endo-beta-1,2-glucanase [Aspergillus tanneri]|uniref:Endo-beta-1,2-glucanase SGL domain-containing protein n=1 Tax=Aspergillus tanneri TaxID=1220188 RepID=A0A5M9MFN2_9EURO|nr:uncharacterized protein ATNIH1004_010716 [Aspergillus tanneri]KAA8641777.1 hypothetical protein ATNIH1004_010716 [Aspergillus tanneri]
MLVYLTTFASLSTAGVAAVLNWHQSTTPTCRFALKYSQEDILWDPSGFVSDYFPSRLCCMRTQSLAPKARFLSPANPGAAPDVALSILKAKLNTCLRFNNTYPGFGGFLPWFTADIRDPAPTSDWVNRAPALDNGELVWAVYAAIQALDNNGTPEYRALARQWQVWMDYVKSTASKVFYARKGQVCAVTTLTNQSWPVDHLDQKYACESDDRLDDPYEGELFTWWLQLFGTLREDHKQRLWDAKRAKLVSFWFSSHEQWKILQMPYYDVDIIRRVSDNAERVRTCNSVVTNNPGMFASVNNSTNVTSGEIMGYISDAGIPSISSQPVRNLDVITPYSVFPALLSNQTVGLAWLRNMLVGQKMQNPYGSTESTRIDGTLVSALVTWDSKVTTMVALLGGVGDLVRQKMQADGIDQDFLLIADREYSAIFTDLKGETVEYCLPQARVPQVGLVDFAGCT